MSELKWKTKEGEILNIENMTTEHIKNCIKAIQENRVQVGKNIDIGYTGDGEGDGIMYEWVNYGKDYLNAFQKELKKRGDIE